VQDRLFESDFDRDFKADLMLRSSENPDRPLYEYSIQKTINLFRNIPYQEWKTSK
jgi:hypothetical protein